MARTSPATALALMWKHFKDRGSTVDGLRIGAVKQSDTIVTVTLENGDQFVYEAR